MRVLKVLENYPQKNLKVVGAKFEKIYAARPKGPWKKYKLKSEGFLQNIFCKFMLEGLKVHEKILVNWSESPWKKICANVHRQT